MAEAAPAGAEAADASEPGAHCVASNKDKTDEKAIRSGEKPFRAHERANRADEKTFKAHEKSFRTRAKAISKKSGRHTPAARIFLTCDAVCHPFAKKSCYICSMNGRHTPYGILIAALLVIVVTLVPHHHHEGGVPCWTVEMCHSDGLPNDPHTAHGHRDIHAHHALFLPATHTAKAAYGAAHDGGADRLMPFLPYSFWQGNQSFIYTANAVPAAPRSLLVQPRALRRAIDRRGPPVC